MHPPAGIELVTRRSRLNLRLRLIAAFAAGVLAVGCGAFVADPGYRATQLPDDVTKLFEVQQLVANPDADTVWIFEQGGPAHGISNEVLIAFLSFRGHEDIHLVQAHQTLTLNPRLAARHARLSLANLQAEVDVSVEVLRRVIDHFKAQDKRVVVVGYSYGSFLVARYLALHGPDGADRYLLMAGRLYNLAPTGRRGIASVTFYAGGEPARPAVPLTAATRRFLRPLLDKPVSSDVSGEFRGTIRAVDLDARRFVLRGVPDVGAIRCAYPAALDARVRSLLASGAKIEVRGSHEPTNHPRLVQVEGEIAEAE